MRDDTQTEAYAPAGNPAAAGPSPAPGGDSGAYLAYLSRTAMEFVKLTPQADIYHHIAVRLRELLGDAVVAVSSYDTATNEMCQRALAGDGRLLGPATALAGTKLRGFRHTVNEEARRQIHTGRLLRVEEGLYEALFRTVPRAVTVAVERTVGIREVYGMGCLASGECFGTALMMLRSKGRMPPVEVLEAFVSQGAVALQRQKAERALLTSEERYRTLMELAPDAYLVISPDATILDANGRACETVGLPREELIGARLTDFFDASELAVKPLAWERISRRESFSTTRRIRRGDGSFVTLEAHLAPLPDGQTLITARDVTDRRRLERELVEVGQRERQAMGHELHDSLGQRLTGLAFLTAALEKRLAARGVPEAGSVAEISRLLGDSVAETRRIARGLCPVDVTEEGLAVSLQQLAEDLSRTCGVRCEFVLSAEGGLPQGTVASHLHRIAQEAATNGVRHGRATELGIELGSNAGLGTLTIRDNGCGIDPQARDRTGLGLRIMRYRADMIDGTLDIQTGPHGTTVTCTFAAPPQEAATPAQ